jgi:DNA-directed RNA polymerase subunit RPC12/RpoP
MYVVVKCPYCGALRIANASSIRIQCFRCEKTFKWNPRRKLSYALFSSEDIRECIKWINEHTPHATISSLDQYLEGEQHV